MRHPRGPRTSGGSRAAVTTPLEQEGLEEIEMTWVLPPTRITTEMEEEGR